ncbi:hypothetical protein CHUAL_004535 [Chamberlinius hualienensis]
MSGTVIEQTVIPSKLGSLPTHVIWSNDGPNDEFVTPNHRYSRERATSNTTVKSYTSNDERPTSNNSDAAQRIQLERNLRFLKIQHQKMLKDLYMEIEMLKSRNRELQFQLAFGLPLIDENERETEVSTEVKAESSKIGSAIAYVSKETQTELRNPSHRLKNMEDELHRLRLALEEAETKNTCLNSLLSQLKRSHLKLKSAEGIAFRNNIPSSAHNATVQKASQFPTNTAQIEEYEKLIGSLRKENIEQKKELLYIRSTLSKVNRKEVHNDQKKQSSNLPRIPTSKELPKPSHEHRNSIELPPINHKHTRRSYSSKASTPLFTQETKELKKN